MSKEDVRLNIPNLISFARLLSVPLTVWLILSEFHQAAFGIFVAACISDAADGFIAKRFNLQTELGGFLDPIADKVLLISVFITLGHVGMIDIWLVLLVVFRDALILMGASLYHLLYQSLVMQPLRSSKVNTAAQFVLAAGVMGMAAFGMENDLIVDILSIGVAATTFWSGSTYVFIWSRRAVAMEAGE